jgi:hypothetical protein
MSSAAAPSLIPQIEITEPDTNPITPAATPEKRKRSETIDTTSQRAPKVPRLDSPTPPADESPVSTTHYGVYKHDLLKEPGNAVPQLVTMATDFNSAYEAMRKHAVGLIEANVHWGATTELNTNNLYEILDSRNRILLRYELDAVSPAGEDADGVQIWERASASPAPPVHYGMYVDLHCDSKDGAERFFIGGFKSLGEANHAMKQSAAVYLDGKGGAKLYEMSIEMMSEKGQLQRRFTIEKGRRSQNGSFVREADWHLERDSTDARVPVIRLPTPEAPKLSEQPTAPPIARKTVPGAARQDTPQIALQVPAPVVSKPEAAQTTRRQSQRLQPANEKEEKQPKTKPQTKINTPGKPKGPVEAKAQAQLETLSDPNPYCTCRLPDDGTLMIGCDNDKCPIGWYHGRCVNIDRAIPKNKEWYCEMCTRQQKGKKARGTKALAGKTPVEIDAKTPVKRGGRGAAKSKAKKKKSG